MRKAMWAILVAGALVITACSTDSTNSTSVTSTGSGQASTKSPIRLGYVIADWTNLDKLTGDTTDDPAHQNAQMVVEMNALVKWANAHGGVDGRKIIATPFKVDQLATETQQLAECVKITEDYNEQVVIDTSIFTQPADWTCFAQHHVAYIGVVSSTDSAFLKTVSPYVASTFPTIDEQMRMEVSGLSKVGFLKGGKLGFMLLNSPTIKQDFAEVWQPALARLGIKAEVQYFLEDDKTTTDNALLQMKSAGVTHIVVFGDVLAYEFLAAEGPAEDYYPAYAWSDFQALAAEAAQVGNAKVNANSVAVSALFGPSLGVASNASRSSTDNTSPYTSSQITPGYAACIKIYNAEIGTDYDNPGQSGASRAAPNYCNNFLLWLDSARAIGASWTPSNFGAGLAKLGTSFQASQVNATNFSAGTLGGVSDFRVGKYDAQCKCFVAETGYLPIPQS